jgi:thiosulfate reductase cytochrome b subunit
MQHLERKHLRAIRWFHWINFPVLAAMIWTGMWIYWANDVYEIGWGDTTLVHFFPDSVYAALGWVHKLAPGMAWHFFFMWFFAINGFLYVAYTIVSGEWRKLIPEPRSFKDAIEVTLYDIGLRKQLPEQGKYNGAQRIAYTAIVLMGFGSLITGLAIWKYVQFAWLGTLLGGYAAARVEHFALTLGYCFFFLVHIAQVIKAGWNNFCSMVMGYEVVND